MPEVVILATGVANTASVEAWLSRAGVTPRLTVDPRTVEQADALVIPGVGAFGAAMDALRTLSLIDPLAARLAAARPTLGICLGMQILFERSEESPGVHGLGFILGEVRRLPPTARTPHMGWNRVNPAGTNNIVESGAAYFANSYAVVHQPPGWNVSLTTHGAPFVSAIQRGPLLACQFHPELSGAYGARLLDRWLAASSETTPC